MAAGDVYKKFDADVDAAETFDMQPAPGVEVVIHNISCSDSADLEFFDGTVAYTVDRGIGEGSWMGMFLHCTNDAYYRVNPTNDNTKIHCDGVITK